MLISLFYFISGEEPYHGCTDIKPLLLLLLLLLVIIQLTLKWSHSGITCSRDVLGHLKSYGIGSDEAILSKLKLLLAQAGMLFTFYCFALHY